MRTSLFPTALLAVICLGSGLYLALNEDNELLPNTRLYAEQEVDWSQLSGLEIDSSDGNILRAEIRQEQWFIHWIQGERERSFPADVKKLSALIQQLKKAKKSEPKTRLPEKYALLGVNSVDDSDSQSRRVTLKLDGSPVVPLLVGKMAKNGQGHYVRYDDSAQSWLIDQVIDVPMDHLDWLQQPIRAVGSHPIAELVSQDAEGGIKWVISLSDSGDTYRLNTLSSVRLKYDSILKSTVEAVAELTFLDLKPYYKGIQSDLEKVLSLEVKQGEHGLTYVFYKSPDQEYWLSIVNADGGAGDWVYQISDVSMNQLNRNAGDFLKSPVTEFVNSESDEGREEGESPL